MLSLLVFVVITGLLLGQTYRNETTLNSLDHQLEEIKPQATRLQKIDQQYEDLSGYLETLNAIERKSPWSFRSSTNWAGDYLKTPGSPG